MSGKRKVTERRIQINVPAVLFEVFRRVAYERRTTFSALGRQAFEAFLRDDLSVEERAQADYQDYLREMEEQERRRTEWVDNWVSGLSDEEKQKLEYLFREHPEEMSERLKGQSAKRRASAKEHAEKKEEIMAKRRINEEEGRRQARMAEDQERSEERDGPSNAE